MDILDFIDVDSMKSAEKRTHRKARRVRSWYLYEQFKALEKNQVEATQNLKDKLYHGQLHQELRERRERRRLVDEFSMSDSGIDRFSSDIRINVNDSFRSISHFHNVPSHDINQIKNTDTTSLEESQDYPNQNEENIKRIVDTTYDDCNYKHNVIEVVETNSIGNFTKTLSTCGTENFVDATDDTNLADDIKESLEYARKIIADNINLQLETVKENLQCLEEFTNLHEHDALAKFDKDDHIDASVTSFLQNFVEEKIDVDYKDASVTKSFKDVVEKFDIEHKNKSVTTVLQDPVEKFNGNHKDVSVTVLLQDPLQRFDVDREDASITTLLQDSVERHDEYGTDLYSIWSKFVSFAYQLVKLNHGNCYYEYSSQVLTAILACDALCRGLRRMCNILQPYVSPIECIAEDDEAHQLHKRDKVNNKRHRKISATPTKVKKTIGKKESKKSCRSVWKKMSDSPIILHICGDAHMECCRRNSNNITQRPTSSECRRNSDNVVSCATSSECRRNSDNVVSCATSSECRRKLTSNTRRSTLSQSQQSLSITPPEELSTAKSTSTLWPEELRFSFSEDDVFTNGRKVANPMLKLANYIDTIHKNIGGNL